MLTAGTAMERHLYRIIKADGIAAIIVNGRKVLLFKRRSLPFLKNAGAWSFILGHKEHGESYLETAYREIEEEAGIGREHLDLLGKGFAVTLFDEKRGIAWRNIMFIFRSDTARIKKDIENAAFRWATTEDIRRRERYTNIFMAEERILKRLSVHVDG